MRTESSVQVEERFLWFEGKVSPEAMGHVRAGLPTVWPPHTEVLFVGFAYADLPLDKRFDAVFPRDRPREGVQCECRIIAATHQWGKPLLEIPHGWKTICVVEFPNGTPELIRQLPVVNGWHQNGDWVCVTNDATWEKLKSNAN